MSGTSRMDGQWINANIPEEIINKFNAIGLVNPISKEDLHWVINNSSQDGCAIIEQLKRSDITFTAAQTRELILGKETKLDLDTEIKITRRSIKSSRNPLEKLQLERKLNSLYKEKKKWKKTQKFTN